MCQFVQNFVSCVSVKYYLNWFTVGKVITKIKRINFLLRRSVYYKYKYKYNSYFYCATYSLTDGALQKSANTCFTAVDRLK